MSFNRQTMEKPSVSANEGNPDLTRPEPRPLDSTANGWDSRVPANPTQLVTDPVEVQKLIDAGEIPDWYSNGKKYEWSDEYGDVGPRMPELEALLFNMDLHVTEGAYVRELEDFDVTVETDKKFLPALQFEDAGLHPVVMENLRLCGYNKPTPIQAYCIPAINNKKDVMAVAQTGSGKTAAYLLPIISRLMGKAKRLMGPRANLTNGFNPLNHAVRAEPLVLIVCTSRELACQIFDECRRLCYRSMLRPCVAYGGAPLKSQREELQKGCDILVGTSGRLSDFVVNEPRTLSLSRVKYTVIDEADEMMGTDWDEQLRFILGTGASQDDGDHQIIMCSATFARGARQVAKNYMADDYVRIKIGRPGSTHGNIRQQVFWTDTDKKMQCLIDLVKLLPGARTMIFTNSSSKCDRIDAELFAEKLRVCAIHSKLTQRERENAMSSFRDGSTLIMVTTNVTGRGIDVRDMMHIINFDLPSVEYGGIQEYVHRIGRTGRIGNKGLATSFFCEHDDALGEDLVKVLLETNQEIPDFLQHWVPEDHKVSFGDDDSEDEEEADARAGGWGADEGGKDAAPVASDEWGATAVGEAPSWGTAVAPAAPGW